MKPFITRAYNNIELTPYGTVKKTSGTSRLQDESGYYEQILKTPVGIYFPRLLETTVVRTPQDRYGVELEYYAYSNLGERLFDTSFRDHQWETVALQLKSMLKRFSLLKTASTENLKHEMYVGKTEKYFREFAEFHAKTLTNYPQLTINGKTYLNFHDIWHMLKPYYNDICASRFEEVSVIHGDCCFSNILCGCKDGTITIKCIDPRGSFGSRKGIHGHIEYDIAKLRHSTDGAYEALIADRFQLNKVDETEYVLNIDNARELSMVHEIFERLLYSNYDSLETRFIEGTIFVGMCSRHYDSKQRQLAMYLTGIRLLNEVFEEWNSKY